MNTVKHRWGLKAGMAVLLVLALALSGCGSKDGNGNGNASNSASNTDGAASPDKLKEIKVVLDWTPNTNHTGLYVARDNGYFEKHGLKVDIIQPGEAGADTMIASGAADFGVSYQEGVTQARIQGVPLVSLAAVIQHNTSGFASPAEKDITSPKAFEGKTYGGWGSPAEPAVIESLMQEDQGDAKKVKIVNIGDADFFTATKKSIDFAWIFYGWTGVEAELKGQKINMVYLTDYSKKLDYYTPVLATNEKMIAEHKDTVEAFMAAASEGYRFAIDHPDEAAELLIKAVPDLNADLVRASQKWLSPRYQDDAPRWGEQKLSVWTDYAGWMYDHKLLDKQLDAEKAFTNDFLPKKEN
ncbi:ABC transporter substrate-binding protein [Paenibacillus sacheonensis]|uniref:ABC transporter substrate-binding protein n=1 Tax=Paenibacillus sacheonensis TaxID=742054 RepID=UPI00195743E4|nr:ABC transporter substrate-binding protein [Paenibacillus sacheonensis]MBM7564540.1 ABC-type nitrate/sulfonate/bicarbonate transport system substrate-binding protein [Paenibacillus sacheonensis]